MALKHCIIPKNYQNNLGLLETQKAIKLIKDNFEKELSYELNLIRVSAPLFVLKESGLNDNLNGVERPVNFDLKEIPDKDVEVVQSLAKWKRLALKKYDLKRFKGLYTDMNAIRRDEDLDNLHSCYVDQWDWEKVIFSEDRTLEFLKGTVERIVKALHKTSDILHRFYPDLPDLFPEKVFFISSQELENLYPNVCAKEREHLIAKKHRLVFITQIGDILSSGEKHDNRAPDYDDWSLNGDLLVWFPLLNRSVEISSMGIRVNKEKLLEQLEKSNCQNRIQLPFHQDLINNNLPLTMGGGIGQSRICMVMLNKAHIGEVQASLWPKQMIEELEKEGINLL